MSLSELKVGHAVQRIDPYSRISRHVITRTTPTQITLDNGERFTRSGRKIGEPRDAWRWTSAYAWEDGAADAALVRQTEDDERRQMSAAVGDAVQRKTLSLDQLRRIAAILAEPKS